MHIKQIIIQGFKSYKEQTVIEPFSSKHNVIVGRNGSGKSNFFAAIRFVLSDAYTQMGREERQALLHEGSGSAVMSAYVEVIFDNSDERFPTGKDEVILRRTIGLKKDEYSLDRKTTTKNDVMNLLESAGFSRSNPYYIVPQGRVTTLTNMKDPERLTLLKEVAGTQVYEQRRRESLKIMEETDLKRKKIDELLKFIEDRLGELEEEKEELKGYQEKDREKRCLEYTIYHREQVEINTAIEGIDESRVRGLENNDDAQEAFITRETNLQKLDADLNKINQQMKLYRLEKKQFEDDRKQQARQKAQLELKVNSLEESATYTEQAKQSHAEKLEQLLAAIRLRKDELEEITPNYHSQKSKESDIKTKLDEAESIRQRLYAKQGRNAQFKNKKERDEFLKKDIAEITSAIKKQDTLNTNLVSEIENNEERISTLEAEIEELREKLNTRNETLEKLQDDVQNAKESWDKLSDQRKELNRDEAKVDSSKAAAKQEYERVHKALDYMMDRDLARGLAAMRNIKSELQLDGVFGTIAELCEVDERYRTAVEVTGGQSVFHVVVDNDQTASRLIEELARRNAGRITCMPLNRIKVRPATFPGASDAIPMISKINFEPKYAKAFEQIFGKTIICPDLNVAAQYARSHGISAITLEGFSSDKRGALTGGYHDKKRSRLQAVKLVASCLSSLEQETVKSHDLRQRISRLNQEITRATGETNKAETILRKTEDSYIPLRNQLSNKSHEISALKDDLNSKQKSLENVQSSIKADNDQLAAHKAEAASEFKKNLTAAEEKLLEDSIGKVQKLKKDLVSASQKRYELEQRKSGLEIELRENLEMQVDQLKAQSPEDVDGDASKSGGSSSTLKEASRDLKRVTKAIGNLEDKISGIDDAIEQSEQQVQKMEKLKADLQNEQAEEAKTIERLQRKVEKSMAKKAMLSVKATEVQRSIRDLGVLPDEAFEKYDDVASSVLVKRLHKVHDALKKYSHVNKKAYEQYNNFTKQRESLRKRREELDSSQKSIRELIVVLDHRKDEAIERTFRQVSKNFADIFEKLVPAGRGRLIIQRLVDKNHQADNEESDDEEINGDKSKNAVENYTGVGISVSFNSKHDDQQRIQQLSGGQKSLCALALVFSIQQCDPAPFYLFDEIDANLDAQYRTAVAQMVKNLSAEGGQFICTTFRREMVMTADQHYGVTFQNKMSSIDLVSRQEALNFVDGQKQ